MNLQGFGALQGSYNMSALSPTSMGRSSSSKKAGGRSPHLKASSSVKHPMVQNFSASPEHSPDLSALASAIQNSINVNKFS
jgi:hypothetical protein